jgi:hypothetical protein
MRGSIRLTLAALVGLFLVQVAVGHHSVSGQFDVTKTLVLKGTVKRVDWVNPHIYIHLDVAENGKTETWRLGTVPVAMARKAGITKESLLAPGQELKMSLYPARDGTQHLGFVFRIEYPDGHFIATNPDRL